VYGSAASVVGESGVCMTVSQADTGFWLTNKEGKMPVVKGKHYPYTKTGKKAAGKARKTVKRMGKKK